MEALPGGESEGASPGVWCVLPWRHACLLAAFGPPRGPDLGPPMDSECRRNDQPLMSWPRLRRHATPGQALAPCRSGIFGDQLGALPPPPQLMTPAAHGPCGPLQAVWRPPWRRPGGPTPPRPAPAIGPWGHLAPRRHRALPPRPQDRGPDGGRPQAVCGDRAAQLPSSLETHHPVHAGARTAQAGCHRRRMVASRTPQEDVQGQKGTIARSAPCGEPLRLLCWGESQ
jgi:hypothetical protein